MPEFDKKFYWERRQKNVRGQIGFVNAHRIVLDENEKEQRLPLGNVAGPGFSSRKTSGGSHKSVDRGFTKKWSKERKVAVKNRIRKDARHKRNQSVKSLQATV